MRKIGLALAATTCLTFAASIASAADLRPAYKAPPPPPPPVFSWTGFYVGAHVGSAWGTKEHDWFAPGIAGLPAGIALISNSHTVNGFLGGVQAGFNYQVAQWVWGVEAQFSWSDISGSGDCLVVLSCRARVDYLGSIAGRLGFAIDRYLPYVKVGAAWVHDKHDFTLGGATLGSVSQTRWGWMWGTGVEYALNNAWSAKIEYNYMDFGSERFFAGIAGVPLNVDIDQRMHLIKAGVNWRFGGFGYGGPVYAAY